MLYVFITPMILGGTFQLLKILFSNHAFDNTVPFYYFIILLVPTIIYGGIEEIGWRGFLQEELGDRFNLVTIALVIGVIWGLWHIPLFYIQEVSHYTFAVVPFMLGAIMFSTYLTWLYANTKSLLLVVLLHASINASASIGLRFSFTHSLLTYIVQIGFILVGVMMLYRYDKKMKRKKED